jgi:serine/threonine-protein kinase
MKTPAKLDRPGSDRQSEAPIVDRKVTPISAAIKARAHAANLSLKPNAERPKILFLDDEDRILNALSALFRYKYQVFTATDGAQALAILKQHHVHVVVSDQRMPAMTGVEFLRRAKEVSPRTVRILLTGFSDLSAIIDSVNDGEVYRFLNKPWGNQEIQAVIGDALSIGLELENLPQDGQATVATSDPIAIAPSKGDVQKAPAVVMMHDKREVFEQVRLLMGDGQPFLYARNIEECLDMLQARDVAVVVSDLRVGRQDCSDLLKLLKQEHPQVMTIVVADSADADNVIDLINQAKIFRYVLAPCKPQKLKFFIDSALTQFRHCKTNPAMLRQQKADASRPVPQSKASSMILDRLKSLRAVFAPRTTTHK